MTLVFVVDAFCSEAAFSGNPAAVCVLDAALSVSDDELQALAGEMNLSETAFVTEMDAARGLYTLRWFTPTTEVELCGHATLATAHALFAECGAASEQLTFATQSGNLLVSKAADKQLRMEFPLGAPTPLALGDATLGALARALSIERDSVLASAFCAQTSKLVLEVASTATVLAVSADRQQLLAVDFGDAQVWGVIVSTRASDKPDAYQVVSRYFAPWRGIDEDPVTGSAHTVLAAYYKETVGHTFVARQASKRNGLLTVSTDAERVAQGRVWLSGHASTVMAGTLRVPPFASKKRALAQT